MACRPNVRAPEPGSDEDKINKLIDELGKVSAAFVIGVTTVGEGGKASHVFSLGGDDIVCRGLVSRLVDTIAAGRVQE